MDRADFGILRDQLSQFQSKFTDAVENVMRDEFRLSTSRRSLASPLENEPMYSKYNISNGGSPEGDNSLTSPESRTDGRKEARSLAAIRDALEELDEQVESLQALHEQQQRQADNLIEQQKVLEDQIRRRREAMTELQRGQLETALQGVEECRKLLLVQLRSHKGRQVELVEEALSWAEGKSNEKEDLPLPPYSHPLLTPSIIVEEATPTPLQNQRAAYARANERSGRLKGLNFEDDNDEDDPLESVRKLLLRPLPRQLDLDRNTQVEKQDAPKLPENHAPHHEGPSGGLLLDGTELDESDGGEASSATPNRYRLQNQQRSDVMVGRRVESPCEPQSSEDVESSLVVVDSDSDEQDESNNGRECGGAVTNSKRTKPFQQYILRTFGKFGLLATLGFGLGFAGGIAVALRNVHHERQGAKIRASSVLGAKTTRSAGKAPIAVLRPAVTPPRPVGGLPTGSAGKAAGQSCPTGHALLVKDGFPTCVLREKEPISNKQGVRLPDVLSGRG